MKKIYQIMALAAVLTLAPSCSGVLDIMQDNKLSVSNMWKTSNHVESSTYGIYEVMRSNFVTNETSVLYWGELRVGEYMWGASPLFNVRPVDVILNTMNSTSWSASWSTLYSAIDQANAVLKYAPSSSIPMTDAKRSWAMGQAYFARAYCYFWAARLWGDVPLNLQPIESTTQSETYPTRAPKAQVYAQIESDIASALANQANLGTDKYMATKTAVLMLKAEYALWMYTTQGGDKTTYLGMAEEALNGIGISSSLLCDTYGSVFDRAVKNDTPVKNSKEVVFALYNDQSEKKTGGYSHNFALPDANVAPAYRENPVPIVATQWLMYGEQFLAVLRDSRDNHGDTRVKYNLGEGKYASDGSLISWPCKFIGDMSGAKMIEDCDLIYYRAALAVMMDAELKYYKQDYTGALNSLNIIAKRAYGVSNYYTDATKDGVMEALVHEYFLEFPAEGVIWWALIRLDKIWDYNPALDKTRTNMLLWPITKSARDKNSNLAQTEGWY